MSSLIASASPWNNENDNNTTRKRIPTMRKTVKIRPYAGDIISQAEVSETVEGMSTMEDTQVTNEIRSNKVNDIINQMANVNPDNDGHGLADFKPPPMPENHFKRDIPLDIPSERDDASIKIPKPMTNPFMNEQPLGNNSGGFNSYHNAYEPQPTLKPYFSKTGLGKIPEPGIGIYDGRIAEKINYMIHLLEGQEAEKTANVTEEFILYTFLGVFMIYVCDSFSRGGRYIR